VEILPAHENGRGDGHEQHCQPSPTTSPPSKPSASKGVSPVLLNAAYEPVQKK
jgi:hypothetical protein